MSCICFCWHFWLKTWFQLAKFRRDFSVMNWVIIIMTILFFLIFNFTVLIYAITMPQRLLTNFFNSIYFRLSSIDFFFKLRYSLIMFFIFNLIFRVLVAFAGILWVLYTLWIILFILLAIHISVSIVFHRILHHLFQFILRLTFYHLFHL